MNIRFTVKSRVKSRAEASAHLKQPGDAVIVDREGPRWLILSCPCGCGAELPVNLDRRAGPAWRLYESHKGVSIYPSVWRDTDCMSHFIIWRNNVLMLGAEHNEPWFDDSEWSEVELLERVSVTLSSNEQSCEEIADRIPGSVPWDVLRCCRRLCYQGKAIEGRGKALGRFRRT